MLDFSEDFGDLNCQLASGRQDDCLNFARTQEVVFSQIFDKWQRKSQSLARTSEVTRNHVFSVVNWIKAMLLNWEQVSYAHFLEFVNSFSV